MIIQKTQSNYQAPNFDGNVYKLPPKLNKLVKGFIASHLSGHAKVTGDYVLVFRRGISHANDTFTRLGIKVEPKSVSDGEIFENLDNLEAFASKHFQS